MFTFLCAFAVVAMAGCASRPPEPVPAVPRVWLEGVATAGARTVRLPVSGTAIALEAKPLLFEFDLAGIEIVPTPVGDALALTFSPAALRDLERYAVGGVRRLVLLVDDRPLGVHASVSGKRGAAFLFHLEIPKEELPALVQRLRAAAAQARRRLAQPS